MKNDSKKLLNLANILLIISSIIFLILTMADKSSSIYLPLCLGLFYLIFSL